MKKSTGWRKSAVLENGLELGGEIWHVFRSDAETFKSEVFLRNSKIWDMSYDHIEHKRNEKKVPGWEILIIFAILDIVI